MKIEVTKSFTFRIDGENSSKYEFLFQKAKNINNFKNKISEEICKNHKDFQDFVKFDYVNKFRKCEVEYCNSNDITDAIEDVALAYINKFQQAKLKIKVRLGGKAKITYYKKDCKTGKKGQVKEYKLEQRQTKFTKIVQCLVKYYNENYILHVRNNINENEFYKDIIYYIDHKNIGEKLIKYVLQRQDYIKQTVFKKPCYFKSLNFSSLCEQNSGIVQVKNNEKSVIQAFIVLSGQASYKDFIVSKITKGNFKYEEKYFKKFKSGYKLHLPIKYSKKYHGDLKEFNKELDSQGRCRTAYSVMFNHNKTIDIVLTKKVIDDIPTENKNIVGVDLNTKHNLFCLEDGTTIDMERELVIDYIRFVNKLEEKHERKKKLNLPDKQSVKDLKKSIKWRLKINGMWCRKAHELKNLIINKCYNHVVMEDLKLTGKSFGKMDIFEGIKVSKLAKLLNLSSAKHRCRSVFNKNDLQLSLVQPDYSSIACECGCIDRLNRVTQEIFKCIECDISAQADPHSATNLGNRVRDDVLRDALLQFDPSLGCYVPKKINHDQIKNILSGHNRDRYSKLNNQLVNETDGLIC